MFIIFQTEVLDTTHDKRNDLASLTKIRILKFTSKNARCV